MPKRGETVRRLAGDWIESIDSKTGQRYYANVKTGEVTWSFPTEVISAEGFDADAPENWVAKRDKRTARKYYMNVVTKLTQWDRPECLIRRDEQKKKAATDRLSAVQEEELMSEAAGTPVGGMRPSDNDASKLALLSDVDEEDGDARNEAEDYDDHDRYDEDSQESEDDDEFLGYYERVPHPPVYAPPETRRRNPLMLSEQESELDDNGDEAYDDFELEPEENMFSLMRARREEEVDDIDDVRSVHTDSTLFLREVSRRPVPPDEENDELEVTGLTTQQIVRRVQEGAWEKFAQEHWNLNRRGVFRQSRTPLNVMISWKPDMLSAPLLKNVPSELEPHALKISKRILCIMGDKDSARPRDELSRNMIEILLLSAQQITDEAYCQICKQLKGNPSDAGTFSGWQLLLLMLACAAPSPFMQEPLEAYLAAAVQNASPRIALYAEHALHRLQTILQRGSRTETPQLMEIYAIGRLRKINVRVWLPDASFLTVVVESWTTVDEVEEIVAKRLGILRRRPFRLYEEDEEDGSERLLRPDERIMDITSFWARQENETRVHQCNRFVYKVRLYVQVDEADQAAVEMMFVQATEDVATNKYPMLVEDAVPLAALQLQAELGDFLMSGQEDEYFAIRLSSFFPEAVRKHPEFHSLVGKGVKMFKKLHDYSKFEVMLSYLDYLQAMKLYGSVYFYARVDGIDQIPEEVILAVNMQGIFVVDQESKEIVTEYSFNRMVKWGNSNVALMVIVDQHPIAPKIYFKTDVGKAINLLIHDYMEWFLGSAITAVRPIDEISSRPNTSPAQSQQIEFKLDTVQQRALHEAFFGGDEETDIELDQSYMRQSSHRRPRHVRALSVEDLRGLSV